MKQPPVRGTYIHFGKYRDHSVDYLVGMMKDARVTTLRRVYDIPQAELDWQYAKGWNTIGTLLCHILSIEQLFRIWFIEEREVTEEESELWMPGMKMGKYIDSLKGKTLEQHVSDLEESRELIFESLKNVTPDAFFAKKKGYNPETGFNMAWALYHLVEDEVHHRGQISLLRKIYRHLEV